MATDRVEDDGAVRTASERRKFCADSRDYLAEPCAIAEALLAIASGVLLWMGWWDLIEVLLPSAWQWRLAMVVLGVVGLCATRTLYDREALHMMRRGRRAKHEQHDVLMSSMETGGGDGGGESGRCGGSANDSVPESPKTPATHATLPPAALSSSSTASAAARGERLFFNAPKLSARRCCRALAAILIGLSVWVGIWDLVDYNLLPALTNSSCAIAEAHPGPFQLSSSPSCIAVKLILIVLGTLGLWVTRSLYGSRESVHEPPQFQPYT